MSESLGDILARFERRLKNWEKATADDARLAQSFPVKDMATEVRAPTHGLDLHGHVSPGTVVDLLMQQQIEHLRDLHGVDPVVIERATGEGWTLAGHRAAHPSPIRPLERMVAHTRVLEFDAGTVRTEGMLVGLRRNLKAYVQYLWTWRDLTNGRSASQPDSVLVALRNAKVSVPAEQRVFEQRMAAVKTEIRT